MGYQSNNRRKGQQQQRQQKQQGNGGRRGGFSTSGDYGGDFELVGEGEHLVMVTGATVGVSSKGNDMISFRFNVVGPDDVDKDRKLFEHVTLGQRMGLARMQGICLGVDPDMKGDEDDPNGINPWDQGSVHKHLLGGLLVVTVEHEEDTYKGQKRVKERLSFGGCRSLLDEEWSALEEAYGVDAEGGVVIDLPDDAKSWKRGDSAPRGGGYANDDDIPY